jgi:hypothetical protein
MIDHQRAFLNKLRTALDNSFCVPFVPFCELFLPPGDTGAMGSGFNFACDGFRDSLVKH